MKTKYLSMPGEFIGGFLRTLKTLLEEWLVFQVVWGRKLEWELEEERILDEDHNKCKDTETIMESAFLCAFPKGTPTSEKQKLFQISLVQAPSAYPRTGPAH